MRNTIKKLIKDQITQEQSYINEHEQIKAILTPLAGKLLNGITLSKNRLKSFKFARKYGMFYIIGKYEHLIGYNEDPIIKLSDNSDYDKRGFEYYDCCYGSAAKERIEQLKNIDIDLLVKTFSGIKKNFDNLCTLFGDIERNHLGSFHNPIYYNILKSIQPEENTNREKLKLHDFYYIRK